MKNILKHKDVISLCIVLLSVFIFFYPFFLQKKLPIPADTVIGLYNPFRDLYAKDYPNGIPYKNFLVTDPVRQQYIWKKLSIDMYKKGELPIWNPYEMSGKPLLANFQSGVFYPLNVILFIQPFYISWSIYIIAQLILGGVFMYFYLRFLKISYAARIFGSITWIFSGFFISWLEWGNILHTALWLPLMLLSVSKLIESKRRRYEFIWFLILTVSSCTAFFAGHLQSFFYMFIFLFLYALSFWFIRPRNVKKLFALLTYFVIFITITSIQWVPTLQFIDLSGRSLDQTYKTLGWFIPYENLIQFLVPDFFGNPTTLNYYGVFNYGEFIGYTGIASVILVVLVIISRRDKKTLFFLMTLAVCVLLATRNVISELPFIFKIPFISTAQPTRLILLMCFSFAILGALGMDYFQKLKSKSKLFLSILFVGLLICLVSASTMLFKDLYPNANDILVSINNLKLPILLFIIFSGLLVLYTFSKSRIVKNTIIVLIIILATFDLLRFGWKYTPFVNDSYLFPETKITKFLKKDMSLFRIAGTDNQILPPNFATTYGIASIEGYDPLYLRNYAMVIAANERSDHSIAQPFGFNRIITPRNVDSELINFLNVKYVLSFNELNPLKFEKVLEEGKTKLYENKNVLPRAFFVTQVVSVPSSSQIAKKAYDADLQKTAFILGDKDSQEYSVGRVKIIKYSPNKIVIETENNGEGFLVMSDVYYPSFRAKIDSSEAKIEQVNNSFRGILIPKGSHVITLTGGLF